ncbi:MAG: hypothetical protein FD119_2577 [Stygiobacter sp.]|nr:MAG: hypothetical protein FD119_2577 [Stygiobacter sp.]
MAGQFVHMTGTILHHGSSSIRWIIFDRQFEEERVRITEHQELICTRSYVFPLASPPEAAVG